MLNSSELINKVKGYNKFVNPDRLSKAYNFAVKAHENQKRYSALHRNKSRFYKLYK